MPQRPKAAHEDGGAVVDFIDAASAEAMRLSMRAPDVAGVYCIRYGT